MIKRVANGEPYYYIGGSLNNHRVLMTHDWYFATDNERYAEGNYFTNELGAMRCAKHIRKKFLEPIAARKEELASMPGVKAIEKMPMEHRPAAFRNREIMAESIQELKEQMAVCMRRYAERYNTI